MRKPFQAFHGFPAYRARGWPRKDGYGNDEGLSSRKFFHKFLSNHLGKKMAAQYLLDGHTPDGYHDRRRQEAKGLLKIGGAILDFDGAGFAVTLPVGGLAWIALGDSRNIAVKADFFLPSSDRRKPLKKALAGGPREIFLCRRFLDSRAWPNKKSPPFTAVPVPETGQFPPRGSKGNRIGCAHAGRSGALGWTYSVYLEFFPWEAPSAFSGLASRPVGAAGVDVP